LLIEGWPPRGFYSALHTGSYVYAETQGDISEFYDLQTDPYELNNLINDPASKQIIKEYQAKLNLVREPVDIPTPVPDDDNSGTP
jgi:hypothetical protein